jgi:hypothetical protein
MSSRWRDPVRRIVNASVMLALVTGCSRAVELPRHQFEAASHENSKTHRITSKAEAEYVVERFSVADSTLTIEALNPEDVRFGKATLPISISIADVESIQRIENGAPLYVAIIAVGAFIAVAAILSGGDAFTD